MYWYVAVSLTDAGFVPSATTLIYNPQTGDWRDGPSLQHSSPRPYPGGPAVVAVGDRLWALATGWSGKPGESQETVESIGLGETEWRQEKPLPAREAATGWCSGAAACCVGTTIYLLAEPVRPTTACTSNVCRWAALLTPMPRCACFAGLHRPRHGHRSASSLSQ